jgi:Putative transposase/Transposase zinc-binding domain
MQRPALELADIFRRHGPAYRQAHPMPVHHHRLMRAIENCRTAALGGHVDQCSQCQHLRVSYNSCRNRHCPKCQGKQRSQWLEQRTSELLPVEYFHVVFTMPAEAAAIAYQNKTVVYDILFRAAAERLLTIARDPKHLGAEIGFFGILHTWGQNLHHHPHVHCVVSGGGLSPDSDRFIPCRAGFFLPVRVLSRLFRRLFLEALQKAFDRRKLQFFSELKDLSDPQKFARYCKPMACNEWVVYAKPPFAGPEAVLAYLARYTHRVAISNQRLHSLDNDQVTFQWKDYQHRDRIRNMTLDADEFIRRFLIHALPPGFQRIRHYGFLANAHRRAKLELCRKLLTMDRTGLLPVIVVAADGLPAEPSVDPAPRCPVCRIGVMVCLEILPRAIRVDSS